MQYQRSYKSHITKDEHNKDINALLDELTILLCEKGLDAKDEPNEIEIEIENLIDVLNAKKFDTEQ